MISSGEIVLMQTAKTQLGNPRTKKTTESRLLLDSGSQRTYITQRLADELGLKEEKEEEIKFVTFGSSNSTTIKTKTTTLSLKLIDGDEIKISANIVPVISGSIQRRQADMMSSPILNNLVKNVRLADNVPTESETTNIELLIGNDYYLDLVLAQKIEVQPGVYLLGSKFGWLLTGRTTEVDKVHDSSSLLMLTYGTEMTKTEVFQNIDSCVPTKPNLEDFWNVEAIGVVDFPNSDDDELAMKIFKDTLKFERGRYIVRWPWKETDPELPVNKDLVLGRLRSCVKRMKDKPELMKKYDSVIEDQLEKGVIERVQSTDGIRHYIPHHAVIKPTTTKLRVVYDASARSKTGNKSLNECLRRGPILLHDLCGMLMRFRLNKVALVADLEKAFLQISLQPSQRDVTRFLWLKRIDNPTTESDNIEQYRFCRVPFGIISSPFLLAATVDSHLDSYDNDIANKLKNYIYVDNVITGTHSDGEAIHIYHEAKSMFNSASMNLREWRSNSERVNEIIPLEDKAKESRMKILGHLWDSNSDRLTIRKSITLSKDKILTKRNVLKVIASVFDPMGLYAPTVLRGNVLLQELLKLQYDWDDPIENVSILSKWFKTYADLKQLSKISIQRCIILFDQIECHPEYSLLCFCDASATSYSAAIYIHRQCNNKAKADLLFAKTRLAPVKSMTIPRLELMAVLIGVKCLAFVKNQLSFPVYTQHLWTDSKCVLDWVNTNKALSVFVRNKVKEILSYNDLSMSHVNTKENAADLATRGATLDDLSKNELWWHGPEWLTQPIKTLTPQENNQPDITQFSNDNAEKSDVLLKTTEVSDGLLSCTPFGIQEDRYSSVTKLLRVTAYVLRFVKKLKKQKSEKGFLKSSEIQEAEQKWITHFQRKNYAEVFDDILKGKQNNLQVQLGLFVGQNQLLRSKGRLEHANLSEGARCPILLPPKETFTRLLVESIHKQYFHSGISQTLAMVRHRYWIPHGRATVKQVSKSCIVCRKSEGGPYKMPPMPALPRSRVSESHPISHIGLDYLGPLQIKTSEGAMKVWLQTVLKEEECVVNSRLLVYVGDDINSTITLTPNHFLSLNPNIGILNIDTDDADSVYMPKEMCGDKLLKLWRKGVKLLDMFWKSWREDYLISLRERTQMSLKSGRVTSSCKANIGNVVLIKDDLPRGCWRIGKVVELIKSRDNSIRAAKVQSSSGKVFNRPLTHLYPIECSVSENSVVVVPESVSPKLKILDLFHSGKRP